MNFQSGTPVGQNPVFALMLAPLQNERPGSGLLRSWALFLITATGRDWLAFTRLSFKGAL